MGRGRKRLIGQKGRRAGLSPHRGAGPSCVRGPKVESRVQTLPAVKIAVLTGIRENLCRAMMCVLEPPEEEKCSLGRTARVWGM